MYIFYLEHTSKSKVQYIVCKLLKVIIICLYNIPNLLKQYKYLKYKGEKKMVTLRKCSLNKLLFAAKKVLFEFVLNMVLFVALVMILLTKFETP